MIVKVGFIGCGFMGQLAHLHSFSQLPGCRIVALAEARPKLAEAVAARHGIPHIFFSHRDLLASGDVDAVVVAQPFHRNYPLGKEVLGAGLHLFTEKPMAGRLEDAIELVDMAGKRQRIYAVGFMKRHDPGMIAAREVIGEFLASGELGALRMVDMTCFLGDWLQNPGRPIGSDEPAPRDDLIPRYPGFLRPELAWFYDHFLNIFSHNINLLHFLLPGRTVNCVSAHHAHRSVLVALSIGETLISLRGAPTRSHRWEESSVFYFEKGRVEIQSATPLNRQQVAMVTVVREGKNGWMEQRLHAPVEWAFHRQAGAFVQAVADGTALSTSGEACLQDVALMEEIFRKLQSL